MKNVHNKIMSINMQINANNLQCGDKKIKAFTKNLIGKYIYEALLMLSVQSTKIGIMLYKIIKSISTNIKKKNLNNNELIIQQININQGKSIKKILTRSQGRMNYIKKRYSHILITITNNNIRKISHGTKSTSDRISIGNK